MSSGDGTPPATVWYNLRVMRTKKYLNINSNTPLYAVLMYHVTTRTTCGSLCLCRSGWSVQVYRVQSINRNNIYACLYMRPHIQSTISILGLIMIHLQKKHTQCKELCMTHSFLLHSAAKALYSDRAVLTFISPCASNRVCILLILPQRSLLDKIDASYIIHFTLLIIL